MLRVEGGAGMASPVGQDSRNGNGGGQWSRHAGKRVELVIPAGSGLAASADDLLQRADRVAVTLEQMLEPALPREPDRLEVFMVDPERALPVSRDGKSEIAVVSARTGEAADAMIDPIARALIGRWYGPDAAVPQVIVAGVIELLAGRLQRRPVASAADARVREAIANGRAVSIFPIDTLERDDPDRLAVATSFVAWLESTYGGHSLGNLLGAFDPTRVDAAPQSVWFRPFGALEAMWRESLRHERNRSSAFRTLLAHLAPLLRPN